MCIVWHSILSKLLFDTTFYLVYFYCQAQYLIRVYWLILHSIRKCNTARIQLDSSANGQTSEVSAQEAILEELKRCCIVYMHTHSVWKCQWDLGSISAPARSHIGQASCLNTVLNHIQQVLKDSFMSAYRACNNPLPPPVSRFFLVQGPSSGSLSPVAKHE